jgi:hypothetical protein
MSWATDLHASNPTHTKVKEITFKMAHSPAESALYKKNIQKNDLITILIQDYNGKLLIYIYSNNKLLSYRICRQKTKEKM